MSLHSTVLTHGPFSILCVCNDSDYIHVSVFGILSRIILVRNATKSRQKINRLIVISLLEFI